MIKDENIEVILTVRNIGHYLKFKNLNIPKIIKNGKEIIDYGKKITINVNMLKNGSDQKIEVYCDNCLENGLKKIVLKKYNNFLRDREKNNGKDICIDCGHKNSANTQRGSKRYNINYNYDSAKLSGITNRLGIDYIYNLFSEKNIEPLFNPSEYSSNKSKLKFKCKTHDFIGKTTILNLTKCKFPCRICKAKSNNVKMSEKIYNYFEKRNLIPLFEKKDPNFNAHEKLPFVCDCDKNTIQFTTFNNLKMLKNSCKLCAERCGKNSPTWKGGITPLIKNMRGKLDTWKKEKLVESGFRCEITGINCQLVVHHIDNFHILFENMLKQLNIKINPKICDYTENELMLMKNKLYELHKSCKYAVINKELHKLFHKLYGKKNNNVEQYLEFIKRYKNFEFDENLPNKIKYITIFSYQ